jgi:hypothetical protein
MIETSVVLKGCIKGHCHLFDDATVPNEMAETCGLDAVEVGHVWLLAGVCRNTTTTSHHEDDKNV